MSENWQNKDPDEARAVPSDSRGKMGEAKPIGKARGAGRGAKRYADDSMTETIRRGTCWNVSDPI